MTTGKRTEPITPRPAPAHGAIAYDSREVSLEAAPLPTYLRQSDLEDREGER